MLVDDLLVGYSILSSMYLCLCVYVCMCVCMCVCVCVCVFYSFNKKGGDGSFIMFDVTVVSPRAVQIIKVKVGK